MPSVVLFCKSLHVFGFKSIGSKDVMLELRLHFMDLFLSNIGIYPLCVEMNGYFLYGLATFSRKTETLAVKQLSVGQSVD